MNRNIGHYILSSTISLFLFSGLLAQEKVEVSVTIKEDGEVVRDTTYQFEDVSEAKQALKMMNYTSALSEEGHAKAMVFISEDGKKTEIKEIHEDSLVWVSEKDMDGDHVVVIRSKDGDTFDVLVDEESEGTKVVRKKEVKVIVSEDDDATWHVEGDEMIYDKDDNVYIIKGDDEVKMKVMKIMEDEGEGEEVEVIVIKKADNDLDLDEDSDHDEDVEVKVIKKKVK